MIRTIDSNKVYYVYEWFIVDTEEVFYVGKGKNKRYKQTKKRNKFFTDIYNTHDCDVRIVQDNLSEEDAFQKEKDLIAYYRNNTDFRLSNITDGGDGASGYVHSPEVREKISESSKKRWEDESFRDKMLAIRRDENGPYKSVEFRKKISSLVQGENNPNYGNKWNEAQKEHLSEVRINSHVAEGINNPRAKSIICLESGEVFDLIADAQKKYGVKTESSFSIALKNKNRLAANLHWRVFDESLLNENNRFEELLLSLSESQKYPICCPQTKETFNTRKDFLRIKNIGIKRFKKEYSKNGKYVIDNNEYMYVKDYLSRYM